MTVELLRHGDAVVGYHPGSDLDRLRSPRPYLTATSSSGMPVTQEAPDDHPHHLGLSAALPDVDGTSFWGGRTYVRDRGSTLLDNHGAQGVRQREVRDGAVFEQLVWLDRHGEALLEEERTITVRGADENVEISWTTRLTAVADTVTFGSPQTNGREGAFYGGLFWRTPFRSALVRTADGDGLGAAHGSTSPLLAVDAAGASLVAATASGMPWFVRVEGYVGFGPAVAVTHRRRLEQGESLRLDLAVAILDGAPTSPDEVAARLLADVRDPV